MKANQSKASEDEMKQRQAEMAKLEEKEKIAQQIDIDKFNKEDETKRYIAELKEETNRLTLEANERDGGKVESPDDKDLEKFEAELGIKKQGLSQDMKKHNDIMSIKDKEFAKQPAFWLSAKKYLDVVPKKEPSLTL